MQALRHQGDLHLGAFGHVRLLNLLAQSSCHSNGQSLIALSYNSSEDGTLLGLNRPALVIETNACIWFYYGQQQLTLGQLVPDFGQPRAKVDPKISCLVASKAKLFEREGVG